LNRLSRADPDLPPAAVVVVAADVVDVVDADVVEVVAADIVEVVAADVVDVVGAAVVVVVAAGAVELLQLAARIATVAKSTTPAAPRVVREEREDSQLLASLVISIPSSRLIWSPATHDCVSPQLEPSRDRCKWC
jgi:hypothetical protein